LLAFWLTVHAEDWSRLTVARKFGLAWKKGEEVAGVFVAAGLSAAEADPRADAGAAAGRARRHS